MLSVLRQATKKAPTIRHGKKREKWKRKVGQSPLAPPLALVRPSSTKIGVDVVQLDPFELDDVFS